MKEGRKVGKKEGRKEGWKGTRKEGMIYIILYIRYYIYIIFILYATLGLYYIIFILYLLTFIFYILIMRHRPRFRTCSRAGSSTSICAKGRLAPWLLRSSCSEVSARPLVALNCGSARGSYNCNTCKRPTRVRDLHV